MDIYGLYWTDEFGAYRVCPDCNGLLLLVYEGADGEQVWNCEHCWYSFDKADRRTGKIDRTGLGILKCPECGDFRVARDGYDDCYYCSRCQSAYRDVTIETYPTPDGVRGRITAYGPAEHPQDCPNCGDALRKQWFDLPDGKGCWAFPCGHCDIVYHEEGGKLVIPRQCPKCGGYSLSSVLTRTVADYRVSPPRRVEEQFHLCRLCKTEYDTDGDYLHDSDRPQEGQRHDDLGEIGKAPTTPKTRG